jgi:hypothetical protein
MIEAYQALCELFASPEYQEKSAKKKWPVEVSGTHAFGTNGYICMGQRMVNSHIYFFHKHIYNDMLLIATCRKLRPILHLNPFSCFARGLRDQPLNTLMPCVVRWPKIDW